MEEISRFEIDMLDVGAADAFLIHAFRTCRGKECEYVVLVDAGNEGDGKRIMQHINTYYKQHYIDLAICTHCDRDHYGGFKDILDANYRIDRFWIHDPYQHVDVDDVKYVQNRQTLRKRLDDAYAFYDGANLLELLRSKGIEQEEVFTGDTYPPLNIQVLGPDRGYYESLIPDFRVNLDFKKEQEDDDYESRDYSAQDKNALYSRALEDANDDPSKINQSSIVFCFKVSGNTYLFTGDAGKEALHRVVDNDDGHLMNLRWLKVPHHGSKHNMDNAIISYLEPDTSYISTEKYGKYVNRCTVNALKAVGNVYSTHYHGTMCHSWKMCPRQGYSNATSL